MGCIFIIVHKNKFQIYERTERYQNELVRIKCEDEFYLRHDDYSQAGQFLSAEIKDELNIKDYSKYAILFIYESMSVAEVVEFMSTFQDAKQFQQMTLGNALTLVTITKKIYDPNKALYVSYENSTYEIKLNQYRYFETRQNSVASMYRFNAPELISYLSGICAE